MLLRRGLSGVKSEGGVLVTCFDVGGLPVAGREPGMPFISYLFEWKWFRLSLQVWAP